MMRDGIAWQVKLQVASRRLGETKKKEVLSSVTSSSGQQKQEGLDAKVG